jgi:ABC-type branched-subunit amino acid transport system substrate-binding protein
MGAKAVTSCQLSVARKKKWEIVCCIFLFLCGCTVRPHDISRIALLEPFEGRYREVGYNALYAARLAMQDFADSSIELLAIDDGSTVESAVNRARALAQDPLVKAAVVLGYAATADETQHAFGGLPVLVTGSWGAKPADDHVFVMASPLLTEQLTASARIEITDAAQLQAPLVGGDIFALQQYARLQPDVNGVQIVSSGSLPDATFTERYQKTGQYVPPSGLLATLTYDTFGMVLMAMRSQAANTLTDRIATMTYVGLNGSIRFQNGYWADAPIHDYEYDLACLQRNTASGQNIAELCLVPVER